MADRMTDERLAKLGALYPYPNSIRAELHRALLAERGRVARLEAALTDILWPGERGHDLWAGLKRAREQAVAVLAEGATT